MYSWHCEAIDTVGIKPAWTPTIEEVYKSGVPLKIVRVDVEEAYKYGGSLVRKIIDSCPLKNDKKHVAFRLEFKYIYPGFLPVSVTDWHIDGVGPNIYESDDRTHLIIGNDSKLTTQFLKHPVTIEDEQDIMNMGFYDRMNYMRHKASAVYGFEPVHINTGEWVSFTSRHFHRVLTPTEPEFRFYAELVETDDGVMKNWNEGISMESRVYTGNQTLKQIPSLRRTGFKTIEQLEYWKEHQPVPYEL